MSRRIATIYMHVIYHKCLIRGAVATSLLVEEATIRERPLLESGVH